eukprot:CAMPEP_0177700496 /NCGR_PEP_ID=MMETSP0484_2-20121128/6124_1 /TAXON_ID=354590 /ORGANISM="Rhodomonas lens, Strain RHODO" /LENGTH=134 /DNA_ID=CAMNT_0019211697 /DNA_START=69 /DNA_END=470 /DNA_ORIENTATION=-
MIYCFYLFDRNGICLYYEDWNRAKKLMGEAEEQKLIFGLLFSLKASVAQMRPGGEDKPAADALHCYSTSSYKLHYFETPTGLRFILLTDPGVPSLRECLRQVYSHIFVEYVVKNPLQPMDQPITCSYFVQALNK